jgi:hypothetical protein
MIIVIYRRYFVLYAFIGWLYEFRPSIHEQRSADVQLAVSYFMKYFQLCYNYGLVKHIPNEHDDKSRPIIIHEDRQRKIQK